jgi:hypothetical protein
MGVSCPTSYGDGAWLLGCDYITSLIAGLTDSRQKAPDEMLREIDECGRENNK